jgi:hypothetical protein
MIKFLKQWIAGRQAIRRRWQEDARRLAVTDPVNAYYEAQRRAARSRAQGYASEYWHWAKVASEVARIQPRAAMDFEVVKAIADQENPSRL